MIGVRPAVTVHGRVKEIGRAAWDACAATSDYQANPFVAFDFLDILEDPAARWNAPAGGPGTSRSRTRRARSAG